MIMQPAINNVLRISNALLMASAVTFGLLCLMNFLIESDLVEPVVEDPVVFPVVIQKTNKIIEIEKPPIETIDEVTIPPELPENNAIDSDPGINLNTVPKVMTGATTEVDPFMLSDGAYIRLVAAAPTYPQRALARGIEGHVDIRFDILKNGTTANIQILDSQPGSIFDRSVLNAVAKWKYQPSMEGGKPVAVLGVMERVSFEFDR